MVHDIQLHLNNLELGETSDLENVWDYKNAVIEPEYIPVNNFKDYKDIPVIDIQDADNFEFVIGEKLN